MNAVIDVKLQALQANGVVAGTDTIGQTSPITQSDTDALKSYVSGRRNFLVGQLATYDNKTFAITSNGDANFSTAQNPVELQGTAQVAVKTIKINSLAYPASWFSDGTGDNQYKVDNWKVGIRLNVGANALTVQGFDRLGNLTDTRSITITYTGSQPYPVTGVVINEWMANNTSAFQDPANDQFQSWFELYNNDPLAHAFDLSGYTLTDDLAVPAKYVIPNGTIVPPNGFLLVWADNQAGSQEASGDLHVNFQLNPAGEAIGLFAPGGAVVNSLTFAAQGANVSQGRYPDGQAPPFQTMLTPTPRRLNVYP